MKENDKSCCFIGHRKIEITEELEREIRDYVEDLIVTEKVKDFLFGSRSEFNELCLKTVSELKVKYPHIRRIAYSCRNETVTLESEREKWERILSGVEKRDIKLFGVEEEREYKTKYVSGKASYVERNRAMIDDCDYCLFYYTEKYVPTQRIRDKRVMCYYQPKSGTAIAYKYAEQKHKNVKNFYKE